MRPSANCFSVPLPAAYAASTFSRRSSLYAPPHIQARAETLCPERVKNYTRWRTDLAVMDQDGRRAYRRGRSGFR